ncbi:hypothetical protein RF11_11510 [Thelohanellus kitauei]|uniref:Uncharacterized protein n=1 Tax=Thelohanellus kitauei TaxID=669202 RepID=A0A0C2J0Q4_THEKT|nr:hypothetical protein RF11_11510 [Thelohanellus kitauei]
MDRKSEVKNRTSWKCVDKYCRSNMKTDYSYSATIVPLNDQTHSLNPNDNQLRAIIPEMRTQQIKTTSTPRSIVSSDLINTFRPILDYFEDNFVGRFHRTARSVPRFAIEIWNQYDRVMNNLGRTNNNIEEWHRAFSSLAFARHPKISVFLEVLKNEQNISDLKINTLHSITQRQSTQQRFLDRRIKTPVLRFSQVNAIEYLTVLSNLQCFDGSNVDISSKM